MRETDGAIVVQGDLEPLTRDIEAWIPKAAISGDWPREGESGDLAVAEWFVFKRDDVPGEHVPPPDWWAPTPPRGREVQSMVTGRALRPPPRRSDAGEE